MGRCVAFGCALRLGVGLRLGCRSAFRRPLRVGFCVGFDGRGTFCLASCGRVGLGLIGSRALGGAPPEGFNYELFLDDKGEKISKSKQGQGGYQKPQTAERYIKDYGCDVEKIGRASCRERV